MLVNSSQLGVFHAFLGSKRPKVNLMSPTGQPGSNFYIWAQNPMGVLTNKFHPYPINASQVIPFLRSIITFSGKKLLTPERVAGAFSLTGVFFRGSFCMSIPAIKSLCHCSSFRVNCLILV